MNGISTVGLSENTISKLFSDEKLRKGYELVVEYNQKIKKANEVYGKGTIKAEDVMGAEVLKRTTGAPISFQKYLTEGMMKESGMAAKEFREVRNFVKNKTEEDIRALDGYSDTRKDHLIRIKNLQLNETWNKWAKWATK
jgi:hypothetical protein